MKRAFAGLAAIAAMLMIAGSGIVHAQTANQTGIKVQPALFEQEINPGDQFSTSITVTNPDPTAKQFTVSVQDISDMLATGQPVFTASSVPEYGLSSWVTISNPIITIPANGTVSVPFTIHVPATAAPGGHYGAIFVTFGAKRPTFNGTGVGYQVGALIDLRIAGDAKEDAQIQEFSTDKGLYQDPNVTFTAKVENQGNVLLRPRGPIDITNMFGQKVGEVVINNDAAAIFPGTVRSYSVNWTGSGFMMGRFDAVMSLTYGDQGNKTVSRELSFWIIPVMPILAVLASIIFFVLLFIWSIRTYVRKKVASMTSGRSESPEERFLAEGRLPFSRLLFILVATAIFAIIFLMILFFLFG
ncbi:MAG TPA: hypothetical protein VMU07_00925 [Candidatus Paceibacterota bacterium]|nr:hypothetical protein [Candidatus Paceibacterota bacterium]